MHQQSLFADPPKPQPAPTREPTPAERAEQLRQEGMRRAAEARKAPIAEARGMACELALASPYGCVTADDIAAALAAEGLPGLGNAAGAVFAHYKHVYQWTGVWAKSTRPESHGNLLRVWRYREYQATTGRPPRPLPPAVGGVIPWPLPE